MSAIYIWSTRKTGWKSRADVLWLKCWLKICHTFIHCHWIWFILKLKFPNLEHIVAECDWLDLQNKISNNNVVSLYSQSLHALGSCCLSQIKAFKSLLRIFSVPEITKAFQILSFFPLSVYPINAATVCV